MRNSTTNGKSVIWIAYRIFVGWEEVIFADFPLLLTSSRGKSPDPTWRLAFEAARLERGDKVMLCGWKFLLSMEIYIRSK